MKDLRANIWKLYAMRALRSSMFAMPIIVVFFQNIGMTFAQVFLSQAIFSGVAIISEVPTGYFADKYGRRKALISGSFFAFFGYIVYAFAQDFYVVVLAEILLGISVAFISGADSALLYDSLEEIGEIEKYTKKEGGLLVAESVTEAFASIVGGILAVASIRFPFFAAAFVMFFLIPIAFSLKETTPHIKNPLASLSALKIASLAFSIAFINNAILRWYIFLGALLYSSTLIMVWFRQPYFEMASIDLKYFGIIWAILLLFVAVSALFVSKYERFLGASWSIKFLIILAVFAYAILGFVVPQYAIYFLIIFSAIRGFSDPIMRERVQTFAPSELRATILSMQSFVSRIGFVIFGPIIGFFADIFSLQNTLILTSFIIAFFGIIVLWHLQKK